MARARRCAADVRAALSLQIGTRRRELPSDAVEIVIGVVEVGQLGPHSLRRFEHVRQLWTVFPLESDDTVQSCTHFLEALRVVVDGTGVVPDATAHSLDQVEGFGDLLQQVGEGRVEGDEALERAACVSELVGHRPLGVVQSRMHGSRPAGQLLTVLVTSRLGLEFSVFTRRQIRLVDLVQLEAKEVRTGLDVTPAFLAGVEVFGQLLHAPVSHLDRLGERRRTPVRVQNRALVP